MGFYYPTREREQLARTAAGVLDESCSPTQISGAVAPTSQTVYGYLRGARAGDSVTGIVLRLNVAAVGTSPTTARFGLADSAGKILVLSGNLNTAAAWPTGPVKFAFTAPYTILADGGYFACFVVDGTWGTTQPTIGESANSFGGAKVGISGSAPTGFSWATQTDLPAIGASLTLTGQDAANFYNAIY